MSLLVGIKSLDLAEVLGLALDVGDVLVDFGDVLDVLAVRWLALLGVRG